MRIWEIGKRDTTSETMCVLTARSISASSISLWGVPLAAKMRFLPRLRGSCLMMTCAVCTMQVVGGRRGLIVTK